THPRASTRAAGLNVVAPTAIQPSNPRKYFKCLHRRPSRLQGGNETAVRELAVDDDRTRAAFALAASFLDPGEVEIFAQHVQEPCHRICLDFTLFAVNAKPDANFFRHR